MTAPFLESNREILSRQYPALLEEITREGGDILAPEDIKTETAACGEPTLCVKGVYVHSQRDPLRESRRLAESVAAETGPVIILGFGLGYAAQAAAELGRPVIVVEKYRNLLAMAFELRDMGDLLSGKKIIFVLGGTGEGVTNALALLEENTDTRSAPSVIRNRALVDIDKEWYNSVEDRIRTWTMRDDVNAATLKRFGRRWVRNLSRNMNAIRDYPGISRLMGIAASGGDGDAGDGSGADAVPVFLAAAGPGLDRIGPLLGEIRRRCIVVAVDTSLRFFVKNGVPPDFVLVVDPQFWNSRHLDRCVCEHTRLIAESAVYPPVLRLPFKGVYLCGSLFPLGSFVEKQVDPKGALGTGGSVATTAWDFSRSLGGKEIWIAGLDLAYPNLKTHFRGALFEDRSHAGSNRFSPAETWSVRSLRDGFPFYAPSGSGSRVLTDRRLSLYAAWFENSFRKYGEVRNYALFQDGLAIAGIEAADTERFLALPDRREEIEKRLVAAFSRIEDDFYQPEEKQKRTERYQNAVAKLTQSLDKLRTAAEKGAHIAEASLKHSLNPKQREKALKDIDEITRYIINSEVKEIAGFLFPSLENENEAGDPFRAYLKSSLKLFQSLADAARLNEVAQVR